MIDQTCGVITAVSPKASFMVPPRTMAIVYDVTSGGGPCYLRITVDVRTSTYVLNGIFVQSQPYEAAKPIVGASGFSRLAPATPGLQMGSQVDEPALTIANQFVAALFLRRDVSDSQRTIRVRIFHSTFPRISNRGWRAVAGLDVQSGC